MIWPVFEFRPLPGLLKGDIRRYAEGKWLDDDGEYDVCFINHSISLYFEPPYQRNIICSWLTGHWSLDVADHAGGNPWHYALREGATDWGGDWGRNSHPNYKAGSAGMNEICRLHSCANGRHVEMKATDKHIAAGLLRNRETKEVFRFPHGLTCMYCGSAAPVIECSPQVTAEGGE